MICREMVALSPSLRSLPFADLKTADGEIFEASKVYYFFDLQNLRVSESAGFTPVGEYLTANGLRVVSIDRLRSSKNDALTDGQNHLRDEIKKSFGLIEQFELEKMPAGAKKKIGKKNDG